MRMQFTTPTVGESAGQITADRTSRKPLSPDERLLQAFAEFFANINRVQTFRATTNDLLTYGGDHIEQKTTRVANEELAKPEWQEFAALKALAELPDVRSSIIKMTAE